MSGACHYTYEGKMNAKLSMATRFAGVVSPISKGSECQHQLGLSQLSLKLQKEGL